MNFFFINKLVVSELYDNLIEINYIDKSWFFFSNIISVILISFYVILLGIVFPNKAKIVKFLNLISAFYLLIFFYLNSNEYVYAINDINYLFQQNHNLYVNLFFFISTITVFIFFLSISDIFYLEENMKIEYTLLVLYIYIGALLLISSLDFISIIILLECIAFSSYVLVGFERKNKFSTSSALKYLILAAIPSGFFILGLSILYNNYGSFYQDYLELLIVSYDNNTPIHFIPEFQENMKVIVNEDVFQERFTAYTKNLNNFLSAYNPSIVLCLLDIERLLVDYPNTVDFGINSGPLYDKQVVILKEMFENAYINLYVRYITVFYMLLELNTLFEYLYLATTNTPIIHDGGESIELLATFLKNLGNDGIFILNWMSFLSYIMYLINKGLAADNLLLTMILSYFNIHYGQSGNYSRLVYEVLDIKTWYKLDETFFINASHDLKESSIRIWEVLFPRLQETLTTHPELIDIVGQDNFARITEKHAVAMSILTEHAMNMSVTPSWIFNEIFFIEDTISTYCIYNNIFLSTYLVIIFVLINLSFKITAAPFHFWAPSVYGGSPLPTITFLSVFSKLTIIFLFINLFLTVFDNLKFIWQPILFFLGVFSVVISILGAFSEKLFKRFFVYSSIGHVGFMILGVAVLNFEGILGAIDYLILYVISSFIVWFIVMHLTKKTTHLISFKGLAYNYPTLSLILVISLFSISGLPPMGGFFVKFEIFYSLINSSQYFIGYILFLLTVFSFFYYLRLIKIIYFEDNKTLKKNKNLNDIKLRLISILIFILPLYILFMQEPIIYVLKEYILSAIK